MATQSIPVNTEGDLPSDFVLLQAGELPQARFRRSASSPGIVYIANIAGWFDGSTTPADQKGHQPTLEDKMSQAHSLKNRTVFLVVIVAFFICIVSYFALINTKLAIVPALLAFIPASIYTFKLRV